FSSRRRHTRFSRDWSSDVCSSDLKSLSLKDAEGKVATVILQLADDIGKIKQGTVEIERLPYQHDLANMAGTSRETISRTLHTFEIGRASCRERVYISEVALYVKYK